MCTLLKLCSQKYLPLHAPATYAKCHFWSWICDANIDIKIYVGKYKVCHSTKKLETSRMKENTKYDNTTHKLG